MGEVRAKIEGMDCVTCAKSIEKGVSSLGYSCQVDFVNAELIITDQNIDAEKVKKRVEQLGYKVYFEGEEQKKSYSHLIKTIIAVLFTLPFWLAMIFRWELSPKTQWLLATIPTIIGLWHFGKGALASVKNLNPNMDVLVTLGGGIAYFYSIYELFLGNNPNYLFFEAAASIFSVILIGTYLEHYSIQKTRKELQELEKLAPVFANKIDENGKLIKVKAEELNIGDKIKIVTGDSIPVDGTILEGSILVNEALITGESTPISKNPGDKVYSGSVVIEGNATVKVEKTAADSTLMKIIKLAKESGSKRPDVQKLADRISAVFVPTIISISILTFAGNFWLAGVPITEAISRAIAVLVIACPCALGIATPVAVVVGVGRSAKYGILIKDANAFEKIAKSNFILLDKTGTLTEGKFKITEEHFTSPKYSKEEIYSLIYSLELHSQHPIALFFHNKLKNYNPVKLKDIREIKGKGLTATYKNQKISFGRFDNSKFIVLLIDDEVVYKVSLGDSVKPQAKEFIEYLKKHKKEPVLISGDTKENCEKIAKELGISKVYSEVTPEDKLQIVSEYSRKGIVVMFGDGINDAPALSKAHVGIAVGRENALSVSSGSVVLLNTEINTFIKVFRIGKLVYRNIQENLFWAFFYNIIAVPFAIVGIVRPFMGAIAMALSDVIVVFNALLMRRKL